MMKKDIKILQELDCGKKKAYMLKFPDDMLQGLKINNKSMVDTRCLLGMLLMVLQEQEMENNQSALSLDERILLLLNIFDESRAVDIVKPLIS
jgi:hypothetical protein